MARESSILLFVSDQSVHSALQFSLAIEGIEVVDGAAEGVNLSAATAVVIDQVSRVDGLVLLAALRTQGCIASAIVLATNPTMRTRAQAAAAGATLVEKPLLGDELTRALRAALDA